MTYLNNSARPEGRAHTQILSVMTLHDVALNAPLQAGGRRPITKLTTNRIKKTTNRIHAICVAAPARPVSPNIPAINPMIRKVIAQLNIVLSSFSARQFFVHTRSYILIRPSTPVMIK